jgi:hypothetical protein
MNVQEYINVARPIYVPDEAFMTSLQAFTFQQYLNFLFNRDGVPVLNAFPDASKMTNEDIY